MQFPESWLREFCNPPLSSAELADKLTMAGLEVEERVPVAPPFSHVVVGEIIAAEQHPNADRLRVCQVDVGQEQALQIVCGAPNARVGIKIPAALVGAELPPGEDGKPFLIKVGKLRGVASHGMLCSARELKLSEANGGLLELPLDAPVGTSIRTYLNLDDQLFTLKLTPNLAHCLSVYGIAREVAALTGAPLQVPAFPALAPQHAETLAVDIQAPDLCGRFAGRIIKDINPQATTPAWMVERLARCGQRSVSALVDISNYVMFEFGRPSHMFDLQKIHGGLQVRWAHAGETLKLLNGNTITLDDSVGVIADQQAVESLAGIMGGDATAIGDTTRDVFVEAAFWWPKAVVGRSRRYNFSTDAGHRFERGVDPQQLVEHIERISALVVDICGGAVGPVVDEVVNIPQPQPVTLRVARANKVIGMALSQQQCADALRSLSLPVTEGEGTVTVLPPSFRFDLQIEEDLIEEVARVMGYENLPHTPPQAPVTAKIRSESQRGRFAVRRQLAGLGYQETINFSFVEERWERDYAGNANPIQLLNPIASQLSVMRSSLLGSLLNVLKFNTDRKAARVRVFELGRVFRKDATVVDSDISVAGVDQPLRLAALAWGDAEQQQWGVPARVIDFFDVKGDVEALLAPKVPTFVAASHPAMHPGRCARVLVDGVDVGVVGELHPRWRQQEGWQQAPVMFELDLPAVLARDVVQAQPVPRQQPVERDLALVVQESVTHAALMDTIRSSDAPGWLKSVVLFDVYRPKKGTEVAAMTAHEKSLAVRLTLEHPQQATFTEEEIETAVQRALEALRNQLGARLR